MGQNILEGQAKNTEKRRMKAKATMQAPVLIDRPDLVIQEFTLVIRDDASVAVGEKFNCYCGSRNQPVDVAREYEHIGTIQQSGGGDALSSALSTTGMGVLLVRSLDAVAGTAQVELTTNVQHE